jgi:hypothetical protein
MRVEPYALGVQVILVAQMLRQAINVNV